MFCFQYFKGILFFLEFCKTGCFQAIDSGDCEELGILVTFSADTFEQHVVDAAFGGGRHAANGVEPHEAIGKGLPVVVFAGVPGDLTFERTRCFIFRVQGVIEVVISLGLTEPATALLWSGAVLHSTECLRAGNIDVLDKVVVFVLFLIFGGPLLVFFLFRVDRSFVNFLLLCGFVVPILEPCFDIRLVVKLVVAPVVDIVDFRFLFFEDDLGLPVFLNILEVLEALFFHEVEVVTQHPDLFSGLLVPLHVLEEVLVDFFVNGIFVIAREEVDLGLGGSEREVVVVGLHGAGNDSDGEGAGKDADLVHAALVLDVVGKLLGRELEVGHHTLHGEGGTGVTILKINYNLSPPDDLN